jgi:hypothetical protein
MGTGRWTRSRATGRWTPSRVTGSSLRSRVTAPAVKLRIYDGVEAGGVSFDEPRALTVLLTTRTKRDGAKRRSEGGSDRIDSFGSAILLTLRGLLVFFEDKLVRARSWLYQRRSTQDFFSSESFEIYKIQ